VIVYPSPFPYIILIVVSLAIVCMFFLKFPSLRVYRKKRNLLVYSVLVLVLSLLAYQSYELFLGPTLISYSLDNGEKQFYTGRVNTFSISSSNRGMRTASFTLTIKSANASFTLYSQQTYPQSNSTTIKIPFSFPQDGTEVKLVQFTIDENVTGFAFYPSIEPQKDNPLVTTYTRQADGEWNGATSSYTLNALPGAVP
jgi:hypothetical protein